MSEPGRPAARVAVDAAKPTGADAGRADVAVATVLHVDDDPAMGELVARFVGDEAGDVEVLTETEPAVALERVAAGGVDCVVSDYEMPGMDGLALGRVLARIHPEVDFVLFSGRDRSDILDAADDLPVDAVVSKEGGSSGLRTLADRVAGVLD